jgi:peptidyl-prolyl cis-trans isomerase A (cyclophilin A)
MTPFPRSFTAAIALALVPGCAQQPIKVGTAKAPLEAAAPAVFKIDFETTQGPFVVQVTRALAPHGADRLYSMVMSKYFDGSRFYRVVPGFVVQWGAAADAKMTQAWDVKIPDDPVGEKNTRGTLTFAAESDANTRTTHLFINYADNRRLDSMGFAPVGEVVAGMDNVDRIYSGYGQDPDQGRIATEGNAYLEKEFPKLDYITKARIEP